jgi:hypothetical protein
MISLNYKTSNVTSPSLLDKLIKKVNGKKYSEGFREQKRNFINAIKENNYELIVDSLISENEQILSRKNQQDSDRFNLFFNALLVLLLTLAISNLYEILKSTFFNDFKSTLPLAVFIIIVILLLVFSDTSLLHEIGHDYKIYLALNGALYEVKNELKLKQEYNETEILRRQKNTVRKKHL